MYQIIYLKGTKGVIYHNVSDYRFNGYERKSFMTYYRITLASPTIIIAYESIDTVTLIKV